MTVDPLLLLGVLIKLFTAAAYVGAAIAVRRRRVDPRLRVPHLAFVAWWLGVALYSGLGTVTAGAAALGVESLVLALVVRDVSALLLCGAVGALVHYLVFLGRGDNKHGPLVIGGYAATYIGSVFLYNSREPLGLATTGWGVRIVYDSAAFAPLVAVLMLALLVPPIVGAIAYGVLGLRLGDVKVRYRATLVGGSLFLWFGSVLALSTLGTGSVVATVSHALGLVAALATMLAYHPPARIEARLDAAQARLGATASDAAATATPPGPGDASSSFDWGTPSEESLERRQ